VLLDTSAQVELILLTLSNTIILVQETISANLANTECKDLLQESIVEQDTTRTRMAKALANSVHLVITVLQLEDLLLREIVLLVTCAMKELQPTHPLMEPLELCAQSALTAQLALQNLLFVQMELKQLLLPKALVETVLLVNGVLDRLNTTAQKEDIVLLGQSEENYVNQEPTTLPLLASLLLQGAHPVQKDIIVLTELLAQTFVNLAISVEEVLQLHCQLVLLGPTPTTNAQLEGTA
jgi:hypothetical protein